MGGRRVDCRSKKALALFVYLAQRGAPIPRLQLARLFWGTSDDGAARTSLRTALQRLPAELAGALDSGREHLALRAPVALDTARFEALAGEDDVARLAEAAQIYRGAFWADESLDATPELDDWIARERARYRQLSQRVFEGLIARYRESARLDAARAGADREAAFAAARQWLALDPAAEDGHRWLMQLHIDEGRRDAALVQYESCRRELAVAHGRAPGAATRSLYDALVAGPLDSPQAAAGARSEPGHVPQVVAVEVASTSFVGRIDELAALQALFENAACRLVTLQGMGGVGKSRLAHVALQQLAARFEVEAVWVALHELHSADDIVSALALALGLDIGRLPAPLDALVAALKARPSIIVLDNFEHLVGAPAAVDLVVTLLQRLGALRLLVTSREVLGLQEEWVYEVPGLGLPPEDAEAPATASAATELFVERARQAYFGFSAPAEWPHVVRICRLVGGLPLAIELVAAWVRTVPCGDLAQSIEGDLGGLVRRHRNRPLRHRDIEAVIAGSWQRLERDQQRAFAMLAVFAGSFSQQGAQLVAETSLRVLSALVDKSLLLRRSDGRLALHPLIGRFARARLARQASAARGAEHRFAACFGDLLLRERARIDGPEEFEARAALLVELPNLFAARPFWERGDGPGIEVLAEPLLATLMRYSRYPRVTEIAGQLLLATRLPATHAGILIQRGRAHAAIGNGDAALADFGEARRIATTLRSPTLLLPALTYGVAAALPRDDFAQARALLAAIDPLLAEDDVSPLALLARYYRAAAAYLEGNLVGAVAELRSLRETARGRAAPSFVASVQDMLVGALVLRDETEGLEEMALDSLAIHERAGSTGFQARSLNVLANVLLAEPSGARAEEAARHAARSLALIERTGATQTASAIADTLGSALWKTGRLDEAAAAYDKAISFASGSPVMAGEARKHLTTLCLARGDLAGARQQALLLVDTALAHDITVVRLEAALAVAAFASATASDESIRLAREWLRRLLDDSGDHTRKLHEAQSMLAALPPAEPEGKAAPMSSQQWLHAMRTWLLGENADK